MYVKQPRGNTERRRKGLFGGGEGEVLLNGKVGESRNSIQGVSLLFSAEGQLICTGRQIVLK